VTRRRKKIEPRTRAQIQLLWTEYALEVLAPGDLKKIHRENHPKILNK